jgi:mono/diheme cytochrome c family protein
MHLALPLGLLGTLLACAAPRSADTALELQGLPERGLVQYQIDCAGCHGQLGGGNSATPALASSLSTLSDAEVLRAIIEGRGAMRPRRVSDQDAADVLAWMRQTWGGGVSPL